MIHPVAARGPETIFGVGRVVQAEPESDRFTGAMPAKHLCGGEQGRLAVGALGVLVDNVLGYSVAASIGGNAWAVSTEIWLDLLAPLTERKGGSIHADASTIATGSYAAGKVIDAGGDVVALIRQRGRRATQSATDVLLDAPAGTTNFGHNIFDTVGLRPTSDDSMELDVTEELENPSRMLHGGVSFYASEVAASRSRRAGGSDLATSSIHVVHTRGVPSGATVEFRASTRHGGRSLWITDVIGIANDRVSTLATISAGPVGR